MPSSEPTERDLQEIRHAAFELRETNPPQAVKALRKIAKRGGEVEALAQGALGEILLDDFDDVDGALYHFRRLAEIVPQLPAASMGLARALARKGDVSGAQESYVKAVAGLEKIIHAARQAGEEEAPEGLDETVLSVMELAIEERELVDENSQGEPRTHPEEEILQWAESVRLFDSDEDEIGLDDWERFIFLRTMLSALDDKLDAALQHVTRLSALVSLPEPAQHRIRSLAYEAAGESASAADEALAGVRSDPEADAEEIMRAATLLAQQDRVPEAYPLLVRARESMSSDESDEGVPGDIRDEFVRQLDGLLEEFRPPGLVTLGQPKGKKKR